MVLAMLALAFALEERDAVEAARASAAERFRRTFHDSPVAMAVTTIDGRIVETNRALCHAARGPDHRLLGTELRACGPTTAASTSSSRRRRVGAPAETRLVNARGVPVWVEISESPLRRIDGRRRSRSSCCAT